jgi:hypothetical protein
MPAIINWKDYRMAVANLTATNSALSTQHSALRNHLLPLLAYLAVAIVYTWPLVTRFASETPGALLIDRDQMLWDFWWFRYSLLELHQSPFHTALVYWPDYQSPDVQLWFQALQPLNAAAAFVLQPLIGLVPAYNVIVLFAFALAGYGAYLLVSYVSGNRWAGFVGGLAFACFPFHLDMLKGQLHIFSLEFIPFYVYALLRLRDAVEASASLRSGAVVRWLLAAIGFLILITLVDWYNLLFALMLTATLLLAYLWWARRKGWGWLGRQVAAVATVGVAWVIICSPLLIPSFRLLSDKNVWIQLPEQQRILNSSDALALLTPMPINTIGGPIADAVLGNFPSNNPQCSGRLDQCLQRRSFLGYAALTLAAIGVVGYWRRRSRYWLATALVFVILALGPVLQIATWNTGLPLPFALLSKLPGMDITRAPDRFLVPASVAYSVLVGLGVAWLLQGSQWQRWLAAGLSLLLALEFLVIPYPTAPVNAPTFFSDLGRDQANYALFELPLTGHFTADSLRSRYQIFHHKAINGGYLARPLTDNFSIMASVQDWFAAYTIPPDIASGPPTSTITTMFNAYNFRYIILYKHEFGKQVDFDRAQIFLDRLYPGAKVFEDDTIIAYRVPDQPFTTSLILIGEGWHEVEASGGAVRRWIDKDRATLRLVVPAGQAGRYAFNFSAAAFARPRRMSLALGGVQAWQQQIPTVVTSYSVPLDLKEGTNILVLTVPDGYDSPASLGLDAKDYRNLSITLGGLSLGQP